MLHSICQQIWKMQQWPQNWSVFIPIPNKSKDEKCSNYHTIVLISHASKVKLKILQARLQLYVNWELQDVQAGFRKGRGIRDQISNICWNSLAFSVIQCMLAIWSLVPLLFLSSLNIWKFSVHVQLKPSLEDFEHYFDSMQMSAIVW